MMRALSRIRTATPATSCANGCYSAVLGEYESRFLNRSHRSVNRKVQGSNPCSGAKSEFLSGPNTPPGMRSAATVQQLGLCRAQPKESLSPPAFATR